MKAHEIKQELTTNFISGGDAARVLNLSRSRVKTLCQDGRFIGAFKYGEIWIIPKKAIEDYKPKPSGRPRNDNANFIKQLLEDNEVVIGTPRDPQSGQHSSQHENGAVIKTPRTTASAEPVSHGGGDHA